MSDFIAYHQIIKDPIQMVLDSNDYYELLNLRRSVRDFSSRPVPNEVIRNIIMTASSAPSGAHKQPWTYCAVSDPNIKSAIRKAAEQEEYENYHGRMSEAWLQDLAPLGTNDKKEFLEVAPWLIIVFKKSYDVVHDEKRKNYYVNESVGISCGFLLTAIFQAGLVALTHTPSPMNFLKKILNRPEHETPFLLIPVGYPADHAMVPDIHRKREEEVISWYTE
ncbi:MAG: nitroreductase family protein [Saprospiraceae bacterium]|jgi:nitroreductase|nr:nitroreductase family protein [Saprospiraceae bacterium]MBK6814800.1 nitroreductase family protein [Saprospiraceae bacterium]MBK7606348.1 nitroreductase family protein [Saprospiraceae bacterium]MBK8281880.1 nitroreductase family protein [Saprospiraceae bacterium]MBK8511295.1 nitroreductase family protein [Saprospiraceae bacterium]